MEEVKITSDWLKDKIQNFKRNGRTNIYLVKDGYRFGGVDIKTKYLLDDRLDILYRAIEILQEKMSKYYQWWVFCPEIGMDILFEEQNDNSQNSGIE